MKVLEERWYQEECLEALFSFYKSPRQLDSDGNPKPKNAVICLPTGTGKGTVIAKFVKRCFDMVPNTRIMMATHVKELIRQNAADLQDIWPLAPLGIYSAGLKSRDFMQPIVFGGVQSLVGKYPIFGHRDFLIVDEGHLIADEGSYQKLINELMATNPFLKVIMLTATPYRMGMGLITNGNIATDIVYNLCTLDGFARLIAEGYLCPLVVPSQLAVQLDVTGVGFSKGDFIQNQLEEAVDKNDVNYAALTQYLFEAQNRRCGILFASGVKHAEHIWEMLNDVFHTEAVVMHSKRTDDQNDKAIKAWKSGKVKHAVNMNMLTTGLNNPMLDICADLQPTMSTGKHVQKYGRLTRPFPDKRNGLILDFGGNTRRLGPINDPIIPRAKGQGSPGDAPVRVCPNCKNYVHAKQRFCEVCGTEFDFTPIINRQASTVEVMKSDMPVVQMVDVDRVVYTAHTSKTGRQSIKISYYCGLRTYYDWKNVEGSDYNAHIGRDWFRQIYGEPPEGLRNSDVLTLQSYLRKPTQIRVWMNATPNPKVLAQEF